MDDVEDQAGGEEPCHCCGKLSPRLHLMLYTDEMLCDSCAEEYAEADESGPWAS